METEYYDNNIPDEVIDVVAYRNYLKKANSAIMTKLIEQKLSTGETVKLTIVKTHLLRKIEHLPDDEQKKILNLAHIYRKTSGEMISLKKKAYGKNLKNVKTKTSKYKLLEYKEDLIDLFGSFHTMHEVFKIVKEDLKINYVGQADLRVFFEEHADLIKEKQEVHRNSVEGIRLGYKRSRLEERSDLYAKIKARFKSSERQGDAKIMLEILRDIQKDVEGDVLNINGTMKVDIDHKIDLHVKKYLESSIPVKEIILSRVASKTKINPFLLLHDIQTSYYGEVSGVVDEPDFSDEIVYPSQQPYDFDKIKRERKKIEEERNTIDTKYEIVREEKEKATSVSFEDKSDEDVENMKDMDSKSKLKELLRRKLESAKTQSSENILPSNAKTKKI